MPRPKPQNERFFNEPGNVATFTTRQILEDGRPILYVSHDEDDGSWQFLSGDPFSTEDALVVALHEIVEHDQSVCELGDLPLGWIAQRESVERPWKRSRRDD